MFDAMKNAYQEGKDLGILREMNGTNTLTALQIAYMESMEKSLYNEREGTRKMFLDEDFLISQNELMQTK